ncbi:MAG: DNA polymerase I [Deltaproteobacteria bacterium]|nr:DNA polymerase I [Deltaproteobacteria bacterium]
MQKKLLLVDASSSVFRAFFAIPALANSAGVPTNAALGFTTMLQKLLRETRPDYVAVVWDAPGPKRRKAIYPAYKATRDAMPEELRAQFPWIRRIVDAYRLAALEYDGEEADDVIATLARSAERAGVRVEIASTDKDLMQLVSEDVTLVDTMRDRRFSPEAVEARFGVPPAQMLDLRALIGDSSDNIPGVKGIGEKGAAQLLREHGSLDALLANPDAIAQKRAREALRDGAEMARLSRELSRLREDLPLEFDAAKMALREPDAAALSELFRELEFRRLLEDLGAPAPAAVASDPKPDHPVETRIVVGAEALAELARSLEAAAMLSIEPVLEPDDPMRGELLALALSGSPGEAALVPLRGGAGEAALEALRPLLEARERVFVGFDLKRSAIALSRRGVRLSGELRDVAVAAYVANPAQAVDRPEALARTHLDRSVSSAAERFGAGAKRRPFDQVSEAELASHFAALAALDHALLPALERELDRSGQRAIYDELEVPLVAVLARMELAGVRIDLARLAELGKRLEHELAESRRRIFALAGEEFNIGSPKQLQGILFDKLALAPTKRTKTGFSTDESVLEELALTHELPGEILHHRQLAKLSSTYVEALPGLVHPETGRIHCTFNQTVAATGRLSSSKPNLQNIPIRTPLGQEIRAAFVPEEGRLLLSADYSQIELRILAHVSEDPELVKAFREGADIHVRTASQVFGIPESEVSPEQRARTKAINFGIIYGQSGFGLARALGISQTDAREQIETYFARYPGVRTFIDAAIRSAREQGFARTLSGRRRYLPELESGNRALRQAAERMAVNSVIQGTAADVIKRAMVDLDADLRAGAAPSARMILQVHDELVFEVAPGDREALSRCVLERMQNAVQLSVPLVVHVGYGPHWLAAH